jgi:hypothetical protein
VARLQGLFRLKAPGEMHAQERRNLPKDPNHEVMSLSRRGQARSQVSTSDEEELGCLM